MADEKWRILSRDDGEADEIIEFRDVATVRDIVAIGQGEGMLVHRDGWTEWRRPIDVPELREAIRESFEGLTWRVRVGGREYKALGVWTVAEWAEQGRIKPDTEILNPHDGQWRAARDEPKLAGAVFNTAAGCLIGLLTF